MLYTNIYDVNELKDEAISMKAQGFATRHIARSLFSNENYRNRLNAFFKREDVADEIYRQACQIELNKQIEGGVSGNDYTNLEVKEKPSLGAVKKKPTILVIADTQAKSEENLEYLLWVGHYIAEKKPDIIVHIGDHYDFPSLSSYDKGKSSSEGRRLYKDIEAGNTGFEYLNMAMKDIPDYNPRKVFCLGNHECLTPDAEVLTSVGFKKIEDVTTYDFVASMDEQYRLQWDKPKSLIRKNYTGNIVKFNSRSFSFSGTENHRMYYETSGGYIREKLAKDLTNNFKIITALNSENFNQKISDEMIRLSAWMCTDSHFPERGNPILYQRESNAHKIRDLLKILNVDYTEKKRERNITEICGKVLKKPCEASIEFYLHSNPTSVTSNKSLPTFVRNLSEKQWAVFMETLIDADGTIPTKAVNSRVFYGAKLMCDSVQLEATLHGWSASLTEYRSNHWRVNLVKRNTRKQEVVSKSVEHYEGLVHCLEMPLENFVIRQGNKVHVTGNCRLDRYVDDNPELIGTLGIDKLPFDKYGWEVHPFLKPVEIEGIYFVHYLANPFTGKPYAGTAANILSKVGKSFVVGHKQTLDISIRPTIDGSLQLGIVNGACYDFNEGYKGYQGNHHFRGLTVLHECSNGFGTPMFASLDFMKGKYYGV